MRSPFQCDEAPKRFGIALAYVTYFILSYKAVQAYSAGYTRAIELSLPFESLIPFIPEAFYVYSTAYLIPLLLMFITDIPTLKKILLTFIVASLLHYLVFLAFPIAYSLRPVIPPEADGLTLRVLHLFHQFDSPLNSFPSIHVSFAYMTYHFLKKYQPRLAPLGHAMAYGIALSTIFVKQHYILDVVGGVTVAYFFNRWLISHKYFDEFDLNALILRRNESDDRP